MSSEKEQKSHFIFLNITVAVWTTVMFVLFPACSRGEKNLAEAITEKTKSDHSGGSWRSAMRL